MRSIEKKELIISWITISVAFASVWSGIFQFDEFIHFLPISFVAVGTGLYFTNWHIEPWQSIMAVWPNSGCGKKG